MSAALAWARRRTLVEWLCLGAGLAVFGYVGWDGALWDARFQLALHLIAIGAIGGLALLALRGGSLPHTPIDLPVIALVLAFGVATASAMNLGMSLRATAAIAAYAAMLYVALICIRYRPSWVGVVTAVPVLALSVPTLVSLLVRRVEWVLVGAPGIPPIRLPGEATPFGSVAVPPFVIWPAWALAGLIESPRWRRIVQGGLVLVGVPLTVLSGSRSAWLAMGVTIVAAAIPWAWRRRHRLRPSGSPDARTIGLAVLALVGLAAAIVLVAPRLTAVTSLIYRASLWRDTLSGLEHRSAARHRPGLHAVRATGRGTGLHVPRPPAALAQPAARRARRCRAPRPGSGHRARRCHRLVRRAVAVEDDDRAGGGLPADRARRRRALRGPDVRSGLQPAGDRPPRRRPDRCRSRRVAAVAPPGDADPGGRRGARPRGRHGRRRCRSDRVPRGQRCRRRWRLGGGQPRCSSSRSRSIRGTRQGRSPLRSPPIAPAESTSGATRPSPPSSPDTIPETRHRGSTWRSSARRRVTRLARPARPSEPWPRPASSRPSSSTPHSATRRSGWPTRPMRRTAARCSASGSPPSRSTGRATCRSATRRWRTTSARSSSSTGSWPGGRWTSRSTPPRSPIRRREPSPTPCAVSGARRRSGWSVRSTRHRTASSRGTWRSSSAITGACRSTTSSRSRRSCAADRSRTATPPSRCRPRRSTSRRSGPIRPMDSSARRSASGRARRSPGSSSETLP